MKKYIFIFGRNPELSYAELISYFKNFDFKYKVDYMLNEVAVIYLDKEIDINKLGGTVKIAKVILEGEINDANFYEGSENKVNYSVSYYGKSKLNGFEDYLIHWFKKEKIKAMRKKTGDIGLSPRELKNTIEFLICDKYIGRVYLVSDPSNYKKRDKERIHNDFVRSMSIRLAKILINLSFGKQGKILLDPFCGVGILLEECTYQNIESIGVEVDDKIKAMAVENLRRVDQNNKVKIIKGDSTRIDNLIKRVDCVASEPYLGPYLKKRPKEAEARKIVEELDGLYGRFFKNLRKVLTKGGKVCMIFPVIVDNNGKNHRLRLNEIFNRSGFKISKLEDIKFPISYNERNNIIFREIYVLE